MEKKKGSKDLLRESVIELVGKAPVKKVTVGQICENCGISQRTFYHYFTDKHDLISWVLVDTLADSWDDKEATIHKQLIVIVDNICTHDAFYINAMRYTGQNNFRESIFQPFRTHMCHLITEIHHDVLTKEISDAINFFLYGCIGFMEHCLLTGDIVPTEITVPMFERNIPPILKKYIEPFQADLP